MDIPWSEVIPNLLRFDVILYCALGVLIGLTAGAIPGVSGSMALTLVLPLAMVLDVYQTVAIFSGIYKGAHIGGAITAICFGVPGTSSAAADLFDGYPMTQQGRSKKALDIMLYSSIIADTSSDLVLMFSIGILTPIVYFFGPSELLGALFLAVICIVVFIGGSPLKVCVSLLLGTLISLTGPSEHYAVARFSLGIKALAGGIDLVPLMIGLFAFSHVIVLGLKTARNKIVKSTIDKSKNKSLTLRELISCWREILIGFIVGTIIGALPGVGSTIAGFTSYGVAKKFSRNANQFGKGAIEGLAAVESGNSASSGANFIPLFTIGIPGSTTAALFLVALLLNGITPGPAVVRDRPEIIFSIFALIIVGNFVCLFLSKFLIPIFTHLAYLPNCILSPFIGILAITGVYCYRNSFSDVVVMFIFGLVGYILQKYEFPLAPIVIGFILVPLMEAELIRGIAIGKASISYFFQSIGFNITFGLGVIILLLSALAPLWRKRKKVDSVQ